MNEVERQVESIESMCLQLRLDNQLLNQRVEELINRFNVLDSISNNLDVINLHAGYSVEGISKQLNNIEDRLIDLS